MQTGFAIVQIERANFQNELTLELFKITCETCAVKLKVTNASSIGQVLGCPKCQSMIRVAPPADWQMPEEIRLKLEAEEKARRESESLSSMEFGDIDDVIATSAQKKPANRQRPAGKTNSKPAGKKVAKPKQAKSQPAARRVASQNQAATHNEDLLLPNDQWTASSTRNRRKLVTIVAAIVGGILLLSAVVAAVVANWSGQTEPDKKTAEVVAEPLSDTSELFRAETPEEATNPAGETNETAEAVEPVVETPPAIPETIEQPPFETGETRETAEVTGSEPEQEGSSNKQVTRSGSPNLPDLSNDGGLDKSLDEFLDPTESSSLGSADATAIPDLLRDAGTEQAEIKELAAGFREQQLIGQSTYYVEKPKPLEEKDFGRLKLPCSGVQYVDQPLFIVVGEVSRLTGVPISFAADVIRQGKLDVAEKISIKETDTDFRSILSKIASLSSVPLEVDYDGTGPAVLLAVAVEPPAKPYSIELPNLGEQDDAEELFIKLVKQVVTPGVWRAEDVVHEIRAEEGKLFVSETVPAETWRRIERLVSALPLSKAAIETGEEVPQLNSLVKRAEPFLQKTFKIDNKFPESLERFLGKIYQATGVKLIVDWPSLLAEGWAPTTQVPAGIGESTVEDFLKQICRAMSVSYRVVDESTIEITTFATASQKTDFEAYSIASVLGGKHSPDQLLVALRGALGLEVQTEQNLRVQLDNESQCLLVHAPQFVQRQVQAILDRLK